MEEQNRAAAEIIGRLLDAAQKHLTELHLQRLALKMLCEFWPGEEKPDWHLLVDSERQSTEQTFADKFQVIRATLLDELERNPQQLPEGWEEDVRRLIDDVGDVE